MVQTGGHVGVACFETLPVHEVDGHRRGGGGGGEGGGEGAGDDVHGYCADLSATATATATVGVGASRANDNVRFGD